MLFINLMHGYHIAIPSTEHLTLFKLNFLNSYRKYDTLTNFKLEIGNTEFNNVYAFRN